MRHLLLQQDPFKFIVPNGIHIHPRILKELPNVARRPPLKIFQWSWDVSGLGMFSMVSWESREVLVDWKLANEADTDLSSLVIRDRTEGNCLMWCQGRFRLGFRRRFCT